MKKVIIAEKPSVAKNIADAFNIKKRCDGYFEGENHIITWAFGHIFQLYDAKDYDPVMKSWRLEKFPFIPKKFKYKIKSDSKDKSKADAGAVKQIKTIDDLIKREDVDGVISATDKDREGELISLEILNYLNVRKPIHRLLLNEWTPDEVKKGMDNLVEYSVMKPLQDAGISRQWADWIIGINLTSVATLRYNSGENKILNIGRVLLPTLKIIYDREKEIENFESSTTFKLVCTFKTDDNKEFEATYFLDSNEKFEDKKFLEPLTKILNGKSGQIIDINKEKKREYPPLLFNLSNLQGYVTSKYKGWTSDKVLKVAQSLYEKKYTTYPRTGSVALDESLKEKTRKVLETVKQTVPYKEKVKFSDSKRIFDNSKVESHSAITPTYILPKNITKDEEIVYNAIKNRFLMQFMKVAEHEETKLTIKVNQPELKGVFIAKGKVQLEEGWKIVEKIESKDVILPKLEINSIVDVVDSKVQSIVKKPPKLHTEKTLLRVMETCGKSFKDEEDSDEMMAAILSGFSIGTPATRAETIKKLKTAGYTEAKGKNIKCTSLGRKIVETFPVRELLDLQYTGKLEKTLADIEKGKFKKDDFLTTIINFTINATENIKNDLSMLKNIRVDLPEGKESLGKCPICNNDVVEYDKSYGCTNWKNGCKFAIWKEDKFINSIGKNVSKEMVELLLKNGKVGFRNIKSKKGTLYSAYFRYKFDEKTGYFNWKIEFIQ